MRGKQFTAYAIISTLLEEIAIAVIGFWVLPMWIHIPIWVVVLIMVGWAAYNILTYRPSKKALDKEIPPPGEAMIGLEGKAKTRLESIEGTVPLPLDLPAGCGFYARCLEAKKGICNKDIPPLVEAKKKHGVRCFLYN